jgi:hypothetical protein
MCQRHFRGHFHAGWRTCSLSFFRKATGVALCVGFGVAEARVGVVDFIALAVV